MPFPLHKPRIIASFYMNVLHTKTLNPSTSHFNFKILVFVCVCLCVCFFILLLLHTLYFKSTREIWNKIRNYSDIWLIWLKPSSSIVVPFEYLVLIFSISVHCCWVFFLGYFLRSFFSFLFIWRCSRNNINSNLTLWNKVLHMGLVFSLIAFHIRNDIRNITSTGISIWSHTVDSKWVCQNWLGKIYEIQTVYRYRHLCYYFPFILFISMRCVQNLKKWNCFY